MELRRKSSHRQANFSPRARSLPARTVGAPPPKLRWQRKKSSIQRSDAQDGRQTERRQKRRRAAHRRDIAQAAGESDLATSVALWVSPEKVDAFDKQIGGKQKVVGAAARAIDGAIVADSGDDGR